jgi:hypothetical protein
MGEFRRLVIGLVEILQIFYIIAATVGGAWAGWRIAWLIGLSPYGLQIADRPAAEILFPLIEALIGFFVAATGAALVFMLAEIAANTRTTVLLLEERAGAGRTPSLHREPRF